jgi:hypothetical protein
MAAVAEHMVLRIGLPFFIFEVFFQVAPLPQAVWLQEPRVNPLDRRIKAGTRQAQLIAGMPVQIHSVRMTAPA